MRAEPEPEHTPVEREATATYRTEVLELLAKTSEEQQVLKALAFGSIIVKIFRSAIFMIRLLPHARVVLIALGILLVLQRVTSQAGPISQAQLAALAEEVGLVSVFADLKTVIDEKIQQVVAKVSDVRQIAGSSLLELSRDIGQIETLRSQIEDFLARGNQAGVEEAKIMLATEMRRLLQGMDNLTGNVHDLVIAGQMTELRDQILEVTQDLVERFVPGSRISKLVEETF